MIPGFPSLVLVAAELVSDPVPETLSTGVKMRFSRLYIQAAVELGGCCTTISQQPAIKAHT